MPGSGRPPPPSTIVIPGPGQAPAELLEAGPPRARPPLPPLSTRLRASVLAVAVAVLSAGLLVARDQQEPARPAPAAVDAPPAYLGVSATAGVVTQQRFSTVLDLAVSIAPGGAGLGDSIVQALPLKVQGISARGFALRLIGRPAPLLLDYVSRFARGTEQELQLPTEVVADCTVDVGGQGPILLAVRLTGGPVGAVRVQGGSAVVPALDDLVRRSCRRTPG